MPKTAVFASNTSTLPITGLAKASKRPKSFIGIHFFSPVEKMPLVEIIVGKQTGDEAIARALDYVGSCKQDADRGQRQPRLLHQPLLRHLHRRRREDAGRRHRPAADRKRGQACRHAGRPAGRQRRSEPRARRTRSCSRRARTSAPSTRSRSAGRSCSISSRTCSASAARAAAGFYDYPEGGKKVLWPGSRSEYPRLAQQPGVEELKTRLLYIQALETARCFEEGVLTQRARSRPRLDPRLGFPGLHGRHAVVHRYDRHPRSSSPSASASRRLYGERFKPTKGLLARAQSGETYYDGAARAAAKAS